MLAEILVYLNTVMFRNRLYPLAPTSGPVPHTKIPAGPCKGKGGQLPPGVKPMFLQKA